METWDTQLPTLGSDRDARGVGTIRSTTVFAIVGAIVAALVAAMATSGRGAGAVLVLGIGLTGIGFVVGLLFSVPRVSSSAPAGDRSGQDQTTPEGMRTVVAPSLYSLNTNLEQVSDWLTKIIVGLGLVEARRISEYIANAAALLAGELNQLEPGLDAAGASALAVGILISFPVLGFLLGFFSVRLYISRAIRFADEVVLRRQVIPAATQRAVNAAYREHFSQPDDIVSLLGTQASSQDFASDASLDAPISKLRTRDDLAAKGQAAMLQGHYQDAVAAFTRALSAGPRTPELLLDYARALKRLTPTPWLQIVSSLEEAIGNSGTHTPINTRKEITWELLNAYLYLPPPNGFESAIALANNAAATYCKDDPYTYVYLSAAYGQAYAYYKDNNAADVASRQIELAKQSLRTALDLGHAANLGNAIARWLGDLTQPGIDNDLQLLFTDHPELQGLLKGATDVRPATTTNEPGPANPVRGGDSPESIQDAPPQP